MEPSPNAPSQADLLTGVLDSSLDGIMAFRARRDARGAIEDFQITVVNRKAEQIVGRTSQELVGGTLLQFFPGNIEDGLFDAYREVTETGEAFYTEHHYAHDGLDHWFSIKAAKCGDGFTVTFSDISEQKAGEERFRVLFERSTDAHLLFDEGGIIDCNQAALNMLGYERKEELQQFHPAELSPEFQPDGRRSMEKCVEMDRLAREHGLHRFDWIHRRKDGRDIPVEVTLNPVELSGKDVLLVVWHDLSERYEAERRLRESAERLNEAQALAHLGNWEWTLSNNRIYWSDQVKRMFGMPVDQPAPDFETHKKQIHPEDLAHWESVLEQAVRDHKPYTMKFRALLPDGECRVFESRGQCEVNDQGKLVRTYGTVQDITHAEQTREELKKLSSVAHRTEDGVVIADAQGRVEWINPAFTRITGYTLNELRGQIPGRLLQGEATDPETVARIREKITNGEGFRETLLNYRKTGEAYWIEVEVQPVFDDSGSIKNFIAIERDVTDKINSTRDIEEQRHRLEFALEASKSGLWDWNVKSGETYFSDTWYTMLGYEPGELPMRVSSWIELTHPEDLKKARAVLDAYFDGKAERYACEMRVKNKAGEWQWILDVGEAVERDAEGGVTRMVGLHVDIHEQKEIQQQIAKALELAEQASASKSAFVANMSHEIRTPMNAILGYADLMLDMDQSEADKRNHAMTIRRNGKHLMGILNDVLDISKIEAGKMTVEKTDCVPDQLFADVITLMLPQAMTKGIDLDFEAFDPLPPRILTDPTRVKQVLLNLVGNAIKFTAEGSVKVVVRNQPAEDGEIDLVCEVIDTGVGIEPEHIDHLFKPFSQADESTTRRFGGTGLGLAISHNLCEMLGGELSCTSTPGVGSTFSARIRVGQPTSEKEVKRAARPTGGSSDLLAGVRVLVVEDGIDNQRLIRHYLTKAGAEVEVAENGEEGRDAALEAQTSGRAFDVVLMDMQMPVLDGYNATRQLREAGYDLPIIALTAHASANDRQSCLDAGCTDYLSKPIDRQLLNNTVASYLKTKV